MHGFQTCVLLIIAGSFVIRVKRKKCDPTRLDKVTLSVEIKNNEASVSNVLVLVHNRRTQTTYGVNVNIL